MSHMQSPEDFLRRPKGRPSLTWSNHWNNRLVKQKLNEEVDVLLLLEVSADIDKIISIHQKVSRLLVR